jgi:hypothetical protein
MHVLCRARCRALHVSCASQELPNDVARNFREAEVPTGIDLDVVSKCRAAELLGHIDRGRASAQPWSAVRTSDKPCPRSGQTPG